MTRALWALVAFLSLIMIVVAARRILHLWSPAVDLDASLRAIRCSRWRILFRGWHSLCSVRFSSCRACAGAISSCIAGQDASFSPAGW